MNEANAVVIHEQQPPAPAVTPMAMLQLAVEKGASVEQLERLMALQERYEANEAKKAFVAAMTAFKEKPVWITKNKDVDFQSAKGRTFYRHATLDNVCDMLVPALSAVGISHRWDIEQLDGGQVQVTCILTHSRGHSERTPMKAGRDDTGAKNNIQALGSTVTYLQRYTLLSATGMAVHEQDDDGRSTAESTLPKKISDEKWDALSEEEQSFLNGIADTAHELLRAGKTIDAVDHIDGQKLDADETVALWSRFDSKQRSAMKKAKQERAMKNTPEPPISEAQKKRLEARIAEVGADRDEVKAYVLKTWGKEHFADLTKAEYSTLDGIIDRKAEAKSQPAEPQI